MENTVQLSGVTSHGLKLNYHLSDSVSVEGEGGIENTHTYSATQNDKTRRKYFYVGYRWDFR